MLFWAVDADVWHVSHEAILRFFPPRSGRKHLQLLACCTSDNSPCFPSPFPSFIYSCCLCPPIQHVCLYVISLRRLGPNFERHAVVPDERPLVICIIICVVCSKLQINAVDAKAAGWGVTLPPVLWSERRHVLVFASCLWLRFTCEDGKRQNSWNVFQRLGSVGVICRSAAVSELQSAPFNYSDSLQSFSQLSCAELTSQGCWRFHGGVRGGGDFHLVSPSAIWPISSLGLNRTPGYKVCCLLSSNWTLNGSKPH